MDTATMRQRLHNYLETADDKKVRAIYTIVEEEVDEQKVIYDEGLKATLDSRYKKYKKDPSSVITEAQSKKRLQKLLNTEEH